MCSYLVIDILSLLKMYLQPTCQVRFTPLLMLINHVMAYVLVQGRKSFISTNSNVKIALKNNNWKYMYQLHLISSTGQVFLKKRNTTL